MDNGKSNLPHRLIYELGHTFASRLELDELLGLVVRKCREVFDAEGVSVLLLDPERNEFYFPYFSDLDPNVAARLLEMRFDASKGVAGSVLRSGRSIRVASVAQDPNFYSVIDKHTGFQTKSIMAALLVAGDARLGVIEVLNPLHLENFSDDHLALLEALAESIALAIHNANRVGILRSSAEKLRTEVGALRRDLARHEISSEVIGASPEMSEVFHLMDSAATAPSIAVLLEGENRHRQGAGRARDPSHEHARRQGVPRGQLRGALRASPGERIVRPSAGCLHRRDAQSTRPFSRRQRRSHFSR